MYSQILANPSDGAIYRGNMEIMVYLYVKKGALEIEKWIPLYLSLLSRATTKAVDKT